MAQKPSRSQSDDVDDKDDDDDDEMEENCRRPPQLGPERARAQNSKRRHLRLLRSPKVEGAAALNLAKREAQDDKRLPPAGWWQNKMYFGWIGKNELRVILIY